MSLRPRHWFTFVCLGLIVVLNACAAPQATAATALASANSVVEQWLTDARPMLSALSQVPEARGDDVSACTAIMAAKLKTAAQYTTFGAAHADGNLFCTSQVQTAPANISDRAYFQRAKSTKDFSVGDYQIGKVTKKQSVGLGFPILDASNNFQGVVLAPLDLDWVNQQLSRQNLPASAELVLIDSQGTVLARIPDAPDWVGKSVKDTPLGRTMLNQLTGTANLVGLDSKTRAYAFTNPKGSNQNWFLAVGIAGFGISATEAVVYHAGVR